MDKEQNKFRSPQSASELYRLSDGHLSTNLMPTFAYGWVSRGQRGGSPTVVNLSVLDRNHYFFFQVTRHLSSRG
jgi:hypothetical protein